MWWEVFVTELGSSWPLPLSQHIRHNQLGGGWVPENISLCRQFMFVQLGIFLFVGSVCMCMLCVRLLSPTYKKKSMMLSLGIKTHRSYMGIDVMSSECSSQSRIPFICKSYLLLLTESSSCSGTSSPPSNPETLLEKKKKIAWHEWSIQPKWGKPAASLLPHDSKGLSQSDTRGTKQSDKQVMTKRWSWFF